jgi:hypothetical protein
MSEDAERRPRIKQEGQRFLAGFIAAGCAITFILPIGGMHHAAGTRDAYLSAGLLPAALAWLILWPMPGSSGARMFRTFVVAIGLVGAGGFALRAFPAIAPPPWIQETMASARFVPQALVYIGIGVVGLIGSLLFGGDERAE